MAFRSGTDWEHLEYAACEDMGLSSTRFDDGDAEAVEHRQGGKVDHGQKGEVTMTVWCADGGLSVAHGAAADTSTEA